MSKTAILIGVASIVILGLLVVRFNQTMMEPKSTPAPTQSAVVPVPNTTEPDFQNWHEFKAPSDKFKVLMPSLPQHATEKLEDPKTKESRQYEMFVSQKDNGTIFMISLITMLQEVKIDDNVLSNVISDLVAANPKNKLKKANKGKFKTHPSIDFEIEGDSVYIEGKAFLIDKTLYVLTEASKPENHNGKEFAFFVNSFDLPEKK